jgi:hypothetical protein
MKINKRIIYVLMSALIIGCAETKKEDIADKVIYCDSDKKVKSYDIKDMTDSVFWIVPLETNDNVLIGNIDELEMRNNRIYIMDRLSQSIYIFDMEGKCLGRKRAIGQGPGEYSNLSYMTVTDSSIIVIDHFMEKQIEYRLPSLELIGEERIFEKIWVTEIFYLNGYTYYINEHNDIGPGSKFKLFSRKNNTGDFNRYLPFDKRPLSLGINGPKYAITGNEASLIYPGDDKIYRFRDGKAFPEYEVKFNDEKVVYSSGIVTNVQKDNPVGRIIGINRINESDKYLFIDISVVNAEYNYTCIYNKQDGTTVICGLMNSSRFFAKNFMGIVAHKIIDNKLICWREAPIVHIFSPQMISFNSKEYERKYTNMWENLNEDDNPVLFIFNLK